MTEEVTEAAVPEAVIVSDDTTATAEVPENSSEPTGEAPPPVEAPPGEIDLAEKFNQVTARERELRETEDKIKVERETHTTSRSELDAANKLIQDFKNNPLQGLKNLGIDFKDVAEMVLNEEQPTPEHRVRKLEETLAERDRVAEEAKVKASEEEATAKQEHEVAENERHLSQAKATIREVVDGNEEKYEFIRSQDAYDVVFEVAARAFAETKTLLTWEEAAEKVENQLWEDYDKLTATKKFKDKYQAVPPKISHDDERDMEANYYGRKHIEELYGRSLNNQMTSEGSVAPEKSDYRTDEESKEYLAAKLRKMMEA